MTEPKESELTAMYTLLLFIQTIYILRKYIVLVHEKLLTQMHLRSDAISFVFEKQTPGFPNDLNDF